MGRQQDAERDARSAFQPNHPSAKPSRPGSCSLRGRSRREPPRPGQRGGRQDQHGCSGSHQCRSPVRGGAGEGASNVGPTTCAGSTTRLGTRATPGRSRRRRHRPHRSKGTPAVAPTNRTASPSPPRSRRRVCRWREYATACRCREDLPYGHDERRIGRAPSEVSASLVVSER